MGSVVVLQGAGSGLHSIGRGDRPSHDTEEIMPEARSWIDRLAQRMARWRARGLSGDWVVAVSGGGDSVGMLRVLHHLAPTCGLTFSIAHLDHGSRGEASQADAAFVVELAESLDCPFDLGQWRPTRAGHFAADARRARYDWLIEVARRRGAGVVAVGQTRDDQAETILHRIVRGTGLRGLAGMPRRRRLADDPPIDLIRPMLDVSRDEIRAYLATNGQPFRDDATNADITRTRARIRHVLLPMLARDDNPDVAAAIVRLGGLARSSEKAHEAQLRALNWAASVDLDRVEIDREATRALPAFLRSEMIRSAWRRAGWPEQGMSARRWRRLARLARGGEASGVAIGGGVSATTEGRSLVLRRTEPDRPTEFDPIPLECPGEAVIPWAGGRIVVGSESGDEVIDRDRLVPPLIVRSPRPGDRFEPLGMGGRSQPLADFFRGRNVPRDRRALTPILCDQLGIVWVVGHRIADRVRLTEATRERIGLGWNGFERIPG